MDLTALNEGRFAGMFAYRGSQCFAAIQGPRVKVLKSMQRPFSMFEVVSAVPTMPIQYSLTSGPRKYKFEIFRTSTSGVRDIEY